MNCHPDLGVGVEENCFAKYLGSHDEKVFLALEDKRCYGLNSIIFLTLYLKPVSSFKIQFYV